MDAPYFLPLVGLAAALGAMMNAVAGGGTLVTFPALVALGVPPITANATSTVALWPGTMASMWGYRAELSGGRRWATAFAVPSFAGGVVGALLLLQTPEKRFAAIVPWLILGATALFIAQKPLMMALAERGGVRREIAGADGHLLPPSAAFLLYQFGVAVYGGYFGAGAGILMLAALGLMGLTNIHQMNGLKNWGGGVMNLVAVIIFALSGVVIWPVALAMALGAGIGGIGGSLLAQRVGQVWVRRSVVAIGLASGLSLLLGLI
ncbi:sulfite exporter TauE/SafE family protein [Pseudogemmatithrix spongiicola]|uniref:Probable membrane transporter protein n=1 Tax=Pseudogemmatithrix spongiicola TaxID=3062599 RepID=A0AA49Q3R2_9BACT|nr:sulfite exporter TauE/SafE family protein [Gemmatimonadaceae bacterium 'strain 138']WKW14051.1 sulfite exporter TauE/SafE family protein [Gemmatimonadaceae bacterium 'strain 318']